MITLLLFAVFVFLAWLIVKPAWMPAAPKNKLTEAIFTQADRAGQISTQWTSDLKAWFKKPARLGSLLKKWAADASVPAAARFSHSQQASLAEFRAWVVSIPDAEADGLAAELSAFCQKQGINIRWLLEDRGRADMQAALSALVLFYGLAVRERVNSQPSAALRDWESDPFSRQNRRFGGLLFARLVDANLVVVPANLLFAPEKARLAYLAGAVKSAAASNYEAVLAQVAGVLEDLREPQGQPAVPVTPTPEAPAPEVASAVEEGQPV